MDFDTELGDKEFGEEYDGDYETLAHQAAAEGDTQLLVSAVKQDPGSIQQKDNDGYTPLAHAVLGNHLQAVKRLVKMGADVNAQDAQGRTCLSIAAYQGWSEGLVYLLRKGARQDLVDKSGRTPLHAATYDTDTRPLVTLLKRLAADEINVCDNEKMTALHWAAFHNRPDHLRHLLAKDALPLLADIDGKTPLHWAAQNDSRTCCTILLESPAGGELLNRTDNCGKTALHLAAAAGHPELLHMLTAAAPHQCEEGDNDDRTPLHWAAATGHVTCVRALLKLGVVPDPRDMDGVTPMEYARNAGHSECRAVLENSIRLKAGIKNQTESKQSSKGFLKGLFGKKKDQDTKPSSNASDRLPDVINVNKTPNNTHKPLINSNSKPVQKVSKTNTTGPTFSETHEQKDNNDVRDDVIHTQPGAIGSVGSLEERGHRKKKKKRRDREEGGMSPFSDKTLSTKSNDVTNYNSVQSSMSRGVHLSPLGAHRPPSLTPGIPPSPGLIKRQGELTPLSPLRIDRPLSDRRDVPLPSHMVKLRQEHTGRSRSPTPTPTFNVSGRAVLPEITGLSQDEWGEKREKSEKKKKKKKRHEDKRLLTSSPVDRDGLSEGIVNPSVNPNNSDWHLPPPETKSRDTHMMKEDLEEVMEMLDL